jgi:hypothetical protein
MNRKAIIQRLTQLQRLAGYLQEELGRCLTELQEEGQEKVSPAMPKTHTLSQTVQAQISTEEVGGGTIQAHPWTEDVGSGLFRVPAPMHIGEQDNTPPSS